MTCLLRRRSRFAWLLLAAAFTLSCGDSIGPGSGAVASVEITGIPTDTLEVGTTVKLTGTPLDRAGRPLSGVQVTWVSSDTTVARVAVDGLVTARAFGLAVIVATSGNHSATAQIRVAPGRVASIVIGGVPEGPLATGAVADLTATLYSRAGSLLTDRPVFWTSSNPTVAMVSASGSVSARREGEVEITARSEEVSERVTIRIIDRVESVTVSPSNALLYADQVRPFTATALNGLGGPIAGRAVIWTSSNPATARVDSGGNVTAVAPGTTRIEATIEGVSGSVDIRVLTRPVADWSGATEWVTHQGGPRHTGHVAVTADPVVFRELWSRRPMGTSALNAVATGGDRVFATSDAYFGSQTMVALDAGSGTQLWAHDFGAIHSVHPPAFGGDRVYVTTGGHSDSFLWSFAAATGTVLFRSSYGNQWSRYYAPVVEGETVFMAGGYYGGMYAFDATDGAEIWFSQTNQYEAWTPAVADGKVYAYTGSYNPGVSIVNAATGAGLGFIEDPSFNWNGWSMNVAPALGSRDNLLATQGGRLVSFDLQAGAVGWQRTGNYEGNVTIANGQLYVFNNRQLEVRSEADGALRWIWIPPSGQPRWTTIVTDNLLFVSTDSATWAIDLAEQKHTWSYPAGGRLALSAAGILFIAQDDGTLTAIQLR